MGTNRQRNAARAIPTNYNGYRFRSAQEARWAVFFEKMEIKFMFEPKGYHLSNGENYIPDFYLPDFQCFAEVKGGPLGHLDYDKSVQLVKDTQIPLIVLDTNPDFAFYEMVMPAKEGDGTMIPTVNLVQDPHRNKGKFLTSCCLSRQSDFEEAGFTNVIEAVKAARGARFGT